LSLIFESLKSLEDTDEAPIFIASKPFDGRKLEREKTSYYIKVIWVAILVAALCWTVFALNKNENSQTPIRTDNFSSQSSNSPLVLPKEDPVSLRGDAAIVEDNESTSVPALLIANATMEVQNLTDSVVSVNVEDADIRTKNSAGNNVVVEQAVAIIGTTTLNSAIQLVNPDDAISSRSRSDESEVNQSQQAVLQGLAANVAPVPVPVPVPLPLPVTVLPAVPVPVVSNAENVSSSIPLQTVSQDIAAMSEDVIIESESTKTERLVNSPVTVRPNPVRIRLIVEEARSQILLAIENGNLQDAEQALASIEEQLGANSLFAMRMRAFYLLNTEQYIAASSIYDSLIIDAPDDHESRLNSAWIALKLKDFERAKSRIQPLLSNPSYGARAAELNAELLRIEELGK